KFPHHLAAETVHRSLAGERDQRDVAALARLEPPRGARRQVEPHAARLPAVELQRRVGLEEMIVRAHLDRPIAGVGDSQRHRLAALVELDLAVLDEHFAGDHRKHLSLNVMAGLVPAIHALAQSKAWMPGTRPGMTRRVQRMGSCTVTSFVPSGNVASTWIS